MKVIFSNLEYEPTRLIPLSQQTTVLDMHRSQLATSQHYAPHSLNHYAVSADLWLSDGGMYLNGA